MGLNGCWDKALSTIYSPSPLSAFLLRGVERLILTRHLLPTSIQSRLAASERMEKRNRTGIWFRIFNLWDMAILKSDWRDTKTKRREKETQNGVDTTGFCTARGCEFALCSKLPFCFFYHIPYHFYLDLWGSNTTIHLSSQISYSKCTEA